MKYAVDVLNSHQRLQYTDSSVDLATLTFLTVQICYLL